MNLCCAAFRMLSIPLPSEFRDGDCRLVAGGPKSVMVLFDAHISMVECGRASAIGDAVELIVSNLGEGLVDVVKIVHFDKSQSCSTDDDNLADGIKFTSKHALARGQGSGHGAEQRRGVSGAQSMTDFPLTTFSLHRVMHQHILPYLYPLLITSAIVMLGGPGVGKTPALIVTTMAMGRFHTRNQMRAVASNDIGAQPCAEQASTTTVSSDAFFELIELLFKGDHVQDNMAVMKRASFLVISESALFIRLPSAKHDAIIHRVVVDNVHKDLLEFLDPKDKRFFNNYKNYGQDYDQELQREQEMIIQKWLTPVRHLPSSPESSDHDEPSRAAFGLPPVFPPIGTANRPTRFGPPFVYPSADKKRRTRKKTSCSAFPAPSDVQDPTDDGGDVDMAAVAEADDFMADDETAAAMHGYLVHSDHTKWRRSIEDLLKADNKSIVEMLMEDKILPALPNSNLVLGSTAAAASLARLTQAHTISTLFVDSGGAASDLQTQSALLLLNLTSAPTADLTKILSLERLNPPRTYNRGPGPGSRQTCGVEARDQIIDRAWRVMKERISLIQHTRAGTLLLWNTIRSAQYDYWKHGTDLWLATGNLCSLCTWAMQSFMQPM
ncbi:hypothetical protein AK812_SmicGene12509 [Symbiodinium microadriaticum]|uniref:Uncharacterized protein n=1 Tax=Symbiodinium microadriaticum TaxID=2951 RepID=A0A1Q9EAJ3_SYMMI|nr:hypothetical protein AK812_SmicGene12509 [Symbiodinium microadriaticum]CAE7446861.1 unnamed protein product [Symbiodinium microadriaticum]CAE7948723.1 unnamed protein product [Symbiodinium sp. KB8]